MPTEQKNAYGQVNGRAHRTTVKPSGIEVVDRIYELEKDGPAFGMGHYIPDLWYRIFLDDRDRPHHLAMLVFAEIWFRHRPREARKIQDNCDAVITLSKGFNGERYQFNRAEMAFRLLPFTWRDRGWR